MCAFIQEGGVKAVEANSYALGAWQKKVTGSADLTFSLPLSKHHLHFHATGPCTAVGDQQYKCCRALLEAAA